MSVKVDEWLQEHGIHTVQVTFTDMHGAVRGKRIPAEVFRRKPRAEYAFCDGALAWDVQGIIFEETAFSNFQSGYPDLFAVPDLETLRPCGWSVGEAVVVTDLHHQHHSPITLAPRALLRRAAAAAAGAGWQPGVAVELELHLVDAEGKAAPVRGAPWGLMPGADPLGLMAAVGNGISGTGYRVEQIGWGREPGQIRVQLGALPPLAAADAAVIVKTAIKEIVMGAGLRASFMARPAFSQAGNALRLELGWPGGPAAGAATWEHLLAGCARYLPELCSLMQPTVNSYKRLAPAGASGGPGGYRWGGGGAILAAGRGSDGQPALIESLSGADANPYLAVAAVLAAGAAGLAAAASPPAAPVLPRTLAEAMQRLAGSPWARQSLGEDFVAHWVAMMAHEAELYADAVTDWETRRYADTV